MTSVAIRESIRELMRSDRGPILVAVSSGWLLAIGIRLVFPVLLPQIRSEFGVDLTTAGVLLTVLWVGYAVAQFPGGLLADRIGERCILTVSVLLATVGTVVVATAPILLAFVAGTVLVGIGTGFYGTTRLTVLSDVFDDKSGTAIGINQAVGNVGTATLPAAAGLLAVVVGWRYGFGVLVPLFLATAVGLWVTVPTRTSDPAGVSGTDLLNPVLRGVSRRPVVLATVSMLLVSLVYQGFTGFYPTYLASEKGMSEGFAATLLGLFFASGAVVQFVAGVMSDHVGVRTTLAVFLGISTVALGTLTVVSGTAAIVVVTLLLSSMLAFWPVSHDYIVVALPDEIQGTSFGFIRTGYLSFAALGPSVVGFLGDADLFNESYLGLAVLCAVSAAICVSFPPPDS